MREGQVLSPLSSPDPEIDPADAVAAGAALASDGRSIDDALAYAGLLRGALDAMTRDHTLEIMIAASRTLAAPTEPGDVLPSSPDRSVHHAVKRAVAEEARSRGVAGTGRLVRSR